MKRTLPFLMLFACAPSPYKVGLRAAAEGQYIEASRIWISDLEGDTSKARPRQALTDNAEATWQQHIDIAREHEASGRYASARDAFDAALAFAEELGSLDLLTFSTVAIETERRDLEARWAEVEWNAGIEADAQARWADAVGHFDQVRVLRPDRRGLDEREGLTFALWAEEDVAKYRYADAADHYRAAFALSGRESQDAWASAVEAALGRYALNEGACRKAVAHFDRAGRITGDTQLREDRKRALDCARVGVDVSPLIAEVPLDVDEASVDKMLLDRIEREIERQGTTHIRLLADPLPTGVVVPAHRVSVFGRITAAAVDEPRTTVEKATVEAEFGIPCDRQTTLYDPEAICSAIADVEYELHRRSRTVRLAGSVKVVDNLTGEQKTRPLDIRLNEDATHATNFKVYDGGRLVDAEIGSKLVDGRVLLPPVVAALDRAPPALPTSMALMGDAVRLFAEEAGSAVLEVVDSEPSIPPPHRLVIRDPLTLPDDVGFQTPSQPAPPMEVEPVMPVPTALEPVLPVPVLPDPASLPAAPAPAPGDLP